MDEQSLELRLSRISTRWSDVYRAHSASIDEATAAKWSLLERYRVAIYRYLRGAVRNGDAAEELAQEFAVRFLRSDFRRADPERGRFRDFVKTALYHLAVDYHKKRQTAEANTRPLDFEPAMTDPLLADADRQFTASVREELLSRAWARLADLEREGGQPFHAVLSLRATHPELRSPGLAEQLSAQLGKPLTAVNVRQLLHRARERFADYLLDEVAQTLETPSAEQLEQELIDLGLLEYCRSALQQRSD